MVDRCLSCRIESCDRTETFEDIQGVNESDWDEISPFGIRSGDGVELRGYCPLHAR